MDADEVVRRFADRLKELTTQSGYSVRDLNKKAEIPASTVQDALGGEHFPRLETTLKIIRACAGDVERWRTRWVEVRRALNEARRRKPTPAPATTQDRATDVAAGTPGTKEDAPGQRAQWSRPPWSRPPWSRPPWSRPPPRQLPAAIPDFVGRTGELDLLTGQLDRSVRDAGPVVITSIGGTAGVGKTALALWWGHRVSDRFPDGQLYVDLHGYGPDRPRSSREGLALFLDALGVPMAQVPFEEDARAALYRSLLADRAMLVVLDNAATPEQVRPLLPGSPGCLVIVTSRSDLPGLIAGNGARPIILDRLRPGEAVALLRRIIGQDRVDREPDAAQEIARRCAHLPLALRVVAQRALAGAQLTLAEIAGQLATARHRLDLLATADNDPTTDVRAAFSWSYRALPTGVARLFRLLGLHAGPEISIPVAAALAGLTATEAGQALEILAGMHLLERAARCRYRFHDLLRDYAAEQAAAEETESERRTAVRRALDWYLHTASAGYHVLMINLRPVPLDRPEWDCPTLTFEAPGPALDWYETERINLVAAVHQAAEQNYHAIAWKLSAASSGFFQIRKPWDSWIVTCKIGLSSAEYIGDKHGQSWSLCSLGIAYWGMHRHDEARSCHERALELCREIGDHWGEGILLSHLGDVHRERGHPEDAINCYRRSRDICGTIDTPWGRWGAGLALHNLGHAYRDLGRHDEAITYYERTLKLSDEVGNDPWGKAQTLHYLGDACRMSGRPDEAIARYRQVLTIRRAIGDRHGEATTLNALGIAQRATGNPDAASESWHQARTIFTHLDDPQANSVELQLQALHADQ